MVFGKDRAPCPWRGNRICRRIVDGDGNKNPKRGATNENRTKTSSRLGAVEFSSSGADCRATLNTITSSASRRIIINGPVDQSRQQATGDGTTNGRTIRLHVNLTSNRIGVSDE